MSDVMMCISTCVCCRRLFAYDPIIVPSIRVEGVREPICRRCVDWANPQRVANGVEPIVPKPGAYLDDDDEGAPHGEAEG